MKVSVYFSEGPDRQKPVVDTVSEATSPTSSKYPTCLRKPWSPVAPILSNIMRDANPGSPISTAGCRDPRLLATYNLNTPDSSVHAVRLRGQPFLI